MYGVNARDDAAGKRVRLAPPGIERDKSGLTRSARARLQVVAQRSEFGNDRRKLGCRHAHDRNFARSLATAWLWSCETRDSVTPSTAPISLRFISCS